MNVASATSVCFYAQTEVERNGTRLDGLHASDGVTVSCLWRNSFGCYVLRDWKKEENMI